jgi:hypothetical protein
MPTLQKGNMLTVNHIRPLKSAPLSVLCVLLLAGQPVTQEFCERHSGYTDKPVSQALHLLEELGYISHNERYAWQITPGAAQLPITLPEIPAQAEASRNNSDSVCAATTAIVETSAKRSINAAEAAKNDESENLRLNKNMNTLRKVGVYGAKAQEIAALPHVTPRYIKAHAAYAEHRKDTPGLLIRRMLDGDPAPKRPPSAGDESRKYIRGEYAAFIEH